MDTKQSAKLAQAYQWLSEGEEVEGRYTFAGGATEWQPWNGGAGYDEFRLKPAPLIDRWLNQYQNGINTNCFHSKEEAVRYAQPNAVRVAVHMREVIDPDIERMVKRFLAWKLPNDFAPDTGVSFTPSPIQKPGNLHWPTGTCLLNGPQAEAMIRHILGDEQ